jgi:hypothetical protein
VSVHSHEAAHAAVGYLYQSQWPLLELARRSVEQPDCSLTLELHDDVQWDNNGTPVELLQLKHHVNAQRGLGDKDADLWATITAWMDAHPPQDPLGPVLTLVTTRTAAAGTAAAALRPPNRDPDAARVLLDAAAAGSRAASTSPARARYAALSEAERDVFVARIHVLDGQPPIGTSLEAQVRKALHWALPINHEQTFIDQVWGWWHRRVVELLRRQRATITGFELRAQVEKVGDSYRPDNLPTLVAREDVTFDVEQTYDSRVFVHQLRWIAATTKMLQHAMIDYYRAYTQRARWVDENLIGMSELETFEDDLRDEWERAFELMRAGLASDSDEDATRRAGLALFAQVSNQTSVRVRERYTDPFFMRGRLHDLADTGHLGWHRDFEARVQALLLGDPA